MSGPGEERRRRSKILVDELEGDTTNHHQRASTLQHLRPYRLIGRSRPLCQWPLAFVSIEKLSKIRSPALREFYIRQNAQIEAFEKVDDLLDNRAVHINLIEEYGDDIGTLNPTRRDVAPRSIKLDNWSTTTPKTILFWIHVNLIANVLLMAGKLVVWWLTSSLSVVASLVDSALDLLSTIIIYISASMADRRDWKTKHAFPVGRSRLEPIGVLVFSVIMVVSFLKIADESIEGLLQGATDPVRIGSPSLIIMTMTIGIKIVLWIKCSTIPSSSIQALAQDAETDVKFNFFSILFPVVGYWLWIWQLDPVGALLLSLYVVYSWCNTALEHIDNLTGAAATPQERQMLLYLCTRFSEKIKYITALNAYHAGDRLIVEVDLILDPSLSMRDSHDLGEALQYALETMPVVERAFVHLEYRLGNYSGHME